MRLDNPLLDSIARPIREEFLLEALRARITFMRASVPYWHDRLARAGVDESRIAPRRALVDRIERDVRRGDAGHRASARGRVERRGCGTSTV
jgi:hypothetical protein